jgi:tRNA (guanine37-N1)-methyltransferase
MPVPHDIIGNIAIIKPGKLSEKQIKQEAQNFLKHKNITTVLLKLEKIKGRLRTIKTKFLAGINTKETICKENSCLFKLDIDKTYFSPRLSNERLEVSNIISKENKKSKGKIKNILVMFAGVAPYSIVIAKNNPKSQVYSIELNRLASKYSEENVRLNKLKNIKIIQGDVKKIKQLIKKHNIPSKFDAIIMPRAQLAYTFLKEAFSVAGKNCLVIFYYFLKLEDYPKIPLKAIQSAAKAAKRKIKILRHKRGIEIAPYKYRPRFDFRIF